MKKSRYQALSIVRQAHHNRIITREKHDKEHKRINKLFDDLQILKNKNSFKDDTEARIV